MPDFDALREALAAFDVTLDRVAGDIADSSTIHGSARRRSPRRRVRPSAGASPRSRGRCCAARNRPRSTRSGGSARPSAGCRWNVVETEQARIARPRPAPEVAHQRFPARERPERGLAALPEREVGGVLAVDLLRNGARGVEPRAVEGPVRRRVDGDDRDVCGCRKTIRPAFPPAWTLST